MKYAIDTEFIDTPTCSALISLAIVAENGDHNYFEFEYPQAEITPWLSQHVVPHLGDAPVSFALAACEIESLVYRNGAPEFWCHYGAYDWYWFCRLWGGFVNMPQTWPMLFREFALIQPSVPNIGTAEHNALADAQSVMQAMRLRGLVP